MGARTVVQELCEGVRTMGAVRGLTWAALISVACGGRRPSVIQRRALRCIVWHALLPSIWVQRKRNGWVRSRRGSARAAVSKDSWRRSECTWRVPCERQLARDRTAQKHTQSPVLAPAGSKSPSLSRIGGESVPVRAYTTVEGGGPSRSPQMQLPLLVCDAGRQAGREPKASHVPGPRGKPPPHTAAALTGRLASAQSAYKGERRFTCALAASAEQQACLVPKGGTRVSAPPHGSRELKRLVDPASN